LTNFIAEAFKRMMGVIAGAALIGSIAFGGIVYFRTGGGLQGWVALVVSPLLTIFTFGSLALMIQNNELLKRIADAQQRPAPARRQDRDHTPSPARKEPTLRVGG
jgi:hypothetical protein